MKTLILISALLLIGCSHFTPMSEMSPEQAERFSYLRERSFEARQTDTLGARERRISDTYMLGIR